ncbi:hypothetical protein FN846DRAFT_895799 [Sphaerosporella brunnea]|uniref:Uncharacterized protein n=1 Tax=Sphaerosporella brunnea TaxID=1250544 RepID=A0A5J5EFF5_9PEZI|nr:hypothetical protein FN846DRAFT_895799 [Sphaerosporella brunnea]
MKLVVAATDNAPLSAVAVTNDLTLLRFQRHTRFRPQHRLTIYNPPWHVDRGSRRETYEAGYVTATGQDSIELEPLKRSDLKSRHQPNCDDVDGCRQTYTIGTKPQDSDTWVQARLKCLNASNINDSDLSGEKGTHRASIPRPILQTPQVVTRNEVAATTIVVKKGKTGSSTWRRHWDRSGTFGADLTISLPATGFDNPDLEITVARLNHALSRERSSALRLGLQAYILSDPDTFAPKLDENQSSGGVVVVLQSHLGHCGATYAGTKLLRVAQEAGNIWPTTKAAQYAAYNDEYQSCVSGNPQDLVTETGTTEDPLDTHVIPKRHDQRQKLYTLASDRPGIALIVDAACNGDRTHGNMTQSKLRKTASDEPTVASMALRRQARRLNLVFRPCGGQFCVMFLGHYF